MKNFKAWLIRTSQRRRLIKLKLDLSAPLRLGDVVVATGGDGERKFTYVGKDVYLPIKEKEPRLKVSGMRTLNDFLL